MANNFSASVEGAILPNPTVVNVVNVKYRDETYLSFNDGPPVEAFCKREKKLINSWRKKLAFNQTNEKHWNGLQTYVSHMKVNDI